MKKYLIIGILVVLAIVAASSGCSTYNNFVTLDQNVEAQWSQVQNQYKRRMDLIPNLVSTVRGYAQHESETYENVTLARAGLTNAYNEAANDSTATPAAPDAFGRYNAAQDQLQRALSIYVNAVREAYPELKADQQFLSLQTQLEGTENRIATERGRYIDIVRDYNIRVRRFPANIWAGMFGFQPKPQFEAEPEAQQAPSVQF